LARAPRQPAAAKKPLDISQLIPYVTVNKQWSEK